MEKRHQEPFSIFSVCVAVCTPACTAMQHAAPFPFLFNAIGLRQQCDRARKKCNPSTLWFTILFPPYAVLGHRRPHQKIVCPRLAISATKPQQLKYQNAAYRHYKIINYHQLLRGVKRHSFSSSQESSHAIVHEVVSCSRSFGSFLSSIALLDTKAFSAHASDNVYQIR